MTGVKIEAKNLKKSFGKREILHDVSFDCQPGESVVILGESGMGKSVMMRIVGMLLEATKGSVKIDGQEIVGITERAREKVMRKIGFLFQYSGLFDHLSVWENIMFYDLFIKKKNPHKMKEIAENLMKELGIPEQAIENKPSEISGGMQRRVALARTIVKKPSLILLDEPTTGLDPIICEVINNTINKTRQKTGATMLTITHDLNSALQIGDRIIVLRYGEIIFDGPAFDIFDAKDKYINDFIKAANVNQKTLKV